MSLSEEKTLSTDKPLAEKFHQAEIGYQALEQTSSTSSQVQIKSLVSDLEEIHKLVSRGDLFSPNEEIDDVPTSSLKYAMCPFYLAKLADKAPGERINQLNNSNRYMKEFLTRCEHWQILSDEDLETLSETNPLDALTKRNQKISRRKRKDLLETKIKNVTEFRSKHVQRTGKHLDDDEDPEYDEQKEREFQLNCFQISVIEALETLDMNEKEMVFAKIMAERTGAPGGPPIPDKSRQQHDRDRIPRPRIVGSDGRPINYEGGITTIGPNQSTKRYSNLADYRRNHDWSSELGLGGRGMGVQGNMQQRNSLGIVETAVSRRINAREEVFRNPNPATMSLDEVVELEIKTGKIKLDTPAQKPKHSENGDDEHEEEPTEEENDKATYEAREWDNWKDDHERGAGNTMT